MGVSCRFNQAEGGLKCYDAEGNECSSECSFCDNLRASVVFDTEKLMMVQNIAVFVQNAPSAPRAWTVSYSFDGPMGPWMKFADHQMSELVEGEVSMTEMHGGVIAARYWKIEITSNWGAAEVELKEVRLFGVVNAELSRRLEDVKEITVDGENMEATDYVLKYTFKGEAPLYVQGYTLSVVRINSVNLDNGSTGDKNVLIVGQPKTFYVSISNHEDLSRDTVKYVKGTDCSAPAYGEEKHLVNNTFTVVFNESTDANLTLCYRLQFDETYKPEEYFPIGDFSVQMRDVYSLTALVGASDFAVKGVPKTWRADVLGSSVDDQIGFKINGECVMVPYVLDGFTYTFNYESVEGEEVFPLCYKFVGEEVVVFPELTVRVGHLDSLIQKSGSANVMMTDSSKSFFVQGVGVANGDELFVSSDDHCSSDSVTPAIVSNGAVTVTASTAGALHVCYKFANEPFYWSAVVMNVYDVSFVPGSGDVKILIVNQTKTYDVVIDGPSAHLFTGFMSLVPGLSCLGDAVMTSPMTSTISVTLDRVYEELSMCFTLVHDGVHESPKNYGLMTQKDLWNLRIENSEVLYILSESTTPVNVTGRGISNEDTLFFVENSASCETTPEIIFHVDDSIALVFLPHGYNMLMKMCYRFVNETAIPLERPISVYGIETDLNAYAFMSVTAFFHLQAMPLMSTSDKYTFVQEGLSCPTDDSVYKSVVLNEYNRYVFETSTIATYVLCYKFSGINRYGQFASASTTVIDHIVVYPRDNIYGTAFTYVTKDLVFSGNSVQAGDRVKYVKNSCDESDFNMETTNMEYYTLDASLSLNLFYTATVDTLIMCYSFSKFDDTPKFYPFVNNEYAMHVVGMQNVTVNRGDSQVLVSGVHKTFELNAVDITLESFFLWRTRRIVLLPMLWKIVFSICRTMLLWCYSLDASSSRSSRCVSTSTITTVSSLLI